MHTTYEPHHQATSHRRLPSSKARRDEKKTYLTNCVSWPMDSVNDLNAMIARAKPITLRTFRAQVDREELELIERQLGYVCRSWEKGLRLCNDYHVSYHRSTLEDGTRVVYLTHSAIEYVFA